MPGTLAGRIVALAEGRQLEELARMLESEGATTLRCPMISILDAPDAAPVEGWIRALVDGRFHLVVLMTGEAVRRLLGFAERMGQREAFIDALGRVETLTRGPKPGKALKEIGLTPTRVAATPTTEGIIASLNERPLDRTNVGVTLFGAPHPELEAFLRRAGASVHPVMPYVFAPGSDEGRVIELIDRIAGGEVDVVIFTSSPQVDRLFEVAGRRGGAPLAETLGRTRVAAVGPVVADNLRQRGAPVSVCPDQGWVMKNLVLQLKRAFEPQR